MINLPIIYRVKVWLDPLSGSECPEYYFSFRPSRKRVWEEMVKIKFVEAGSEEEWDWGFEVTSIDITKIIRI